MKNGRISSIGRPAASVLLAVVFCAILASGSLAAEPRWMPGFLSLSTTVPGTGERLDIAAWYPATGARRSANSLQIDGWSFIGGRNLRPGTGPFPLLIISHDSGGSRLSNHDLAVFLAERGFVVAAPTHPGDSAHSMSRMFLPEQISDRPEHIRLTVETVLASTRFPPNGIDTQRVGVIGVGTGAAAALLLVGAAPDGVRITEYCEGAVEDDPYCTQWAQERLLQMRTAFSAAPDPSWADARVAAVALLAPGYGMLFPPESLTRVSTPVFIAAGNQDRIAPPALHAEFIRAGLPVQSENLVLKADHEAFSAPCPAGVGHDLPTLCTRLTPSEHRDMRRILFGRLAGFFRKALAAPSA